MSTPEGRIKKAIVDYLKFHGWGVWRINDRFIKGYPDLYCFKDDRSFWLEVKKPGEKPTLLQREKITELLEQGILATWTDDAGLAGSDIVECVEAWSHEDALVLFKEWAYWLKED